MTKWDIYRAKDGWRWRAWRGGNIVADSGEAYSTRAGARSAAIRFIVAKGRSVFGAPKTTKRRPA